MVRNFLIDSFDKRMLDSTRLDSTRLDSTLNTFTFILHHLLSLHSHCKTVDTAKTNDSESGIDDSTMTVLEPSTSISQNKRTATLAEAHDVNCLKKPCHSKNSQQESVGTNSQWLFRRHDHGEMVLSDNLGDTSAIVDSLTHQVDNWSLTKLPSASKTNKGRCKAAKRQVMRSMARSGQEESAA